VRSDREIADKHEDGIDKIANLLDILEVEGDEVEVQEVAELVLPF
jgi:Ca2+-binding EF-hand superfamily protein